MRFGQLLYTKLEEELTVLDKLGMIGSKLSLSQIDPQSSLQCSTKDFSDILATTIP